MEIDRMTNYNDGKWHGWNGGDCPVHPETVVNMVWPALFNENDAFRAKRKAKEFTWQVSDSSAPSMFRVVKEHREPQPKEYTIDPKGMMIWFDHTDGLIHVREVI